jgi:O-antigen/teichoic acid export membrane protein
MSVRAITSDPHARLIKASSEWLSVGDDRPVALASGIDVLCNANATHQHKERRPAGEHEAGMRTTIGVAGTLMSSLRQKLAEHRHGKALLRGSMLVMATQIAGIGLAYAMQVVIARAAGVFEFGLFAYAWTWMNLIFLVAAFGLNEAALRLIPTYASRGEWGSLRGLITRGPLLVLAAAGAAGLLAAGGLELLGGVVGEHYRLPLLLTFAAAPLIGLLAFLQGAGRALGSALLAFLPRTIGLPLVVLLATGAMVLLGAPPAATALVAVTVVAAGGLAFIQWLMLARRALPPHAGGVKAAFPLRSWLTLALPCLFIAVCYGLLTHCDLLMVGFFLSAEDVAVYQAASRTAALISFPLFAMNALVAPLIARLHAEKKMDELQRTVTLATQVVFWPSLLGGLLAIGAGRWILAIFGPGFNVGHEALAILILGHLVNVAVGPVSYLMTMTGNQISCAIAWAATVAVQLAASLYLIPRWGIDGAALGTALATVVLGVALSLLVRRRLRISAHALVPVWRTAARAPRA